MHPRQFLLLSIFAIAAAAVPQLETATPRESRVDTQSASSNLGALISQLNPSNNPEVYFNLGTSPVTTPQTTVANGSSAPTAIASTPPRFAANNTAQALSSPVAALPTASTPLISANAPAFAAVPSSGPSAGDFTQTILLNLLTAFIDLFAGDTSSSSSPNPLSFLFRGTSQDSTLGRREEASPGKSGRARRDLTASQTYAISQVSDYISNLTQSILATTPSTVSNDLISAAVEGLVRDPALGIQLAYHTFQTALSRR